MSAHPKTLAQLAAAALAVQDACNLSGVVISWANVIANLRDVLETNDTAAINHHPINILWAFKCADLTGQSVDLSIDSKYGDAYTACRRLSEAQHDAALSTGNSGDTTT